MAFTVPIIARPVAFCKAVTAFWTDAGGKGRKQDLSDLPDNIGVAVFGKRGRNFVSVDQER